MINRARPLPGVLLILSVTAALPAQDPPPLPPLPAITPPAPTAQVDGGERYQLVDAFPAQAKFDRPLYIDHHAGDAGVYYVVEQRGVIYRIPRDGSRAERQVFLDWSGRVLSHANGGHNEEGLLGFAFDPAFGETGHVFVYYSRKTGERKFTRRGKEFTEPTRESVIARLGTQKRDGQVVAREDTELVLMRVEQPWGNHNGGTILFGPDRMLYVVLGDGGAANDPLKSGQDLSTLLGSILRIDVRGAKEGALYEVPGDNPFVGREGARGEIWAYGLRNPWRMSFDRETGELWCGDVGQNVWEEVDRIVKGGNYGWNVREGMHRFVVPGGGGGGFGGEKKSVEDTPNPEGMIAPVAEYHHRDGVSVTGGYVYRGSELQELRGQYLYADYQSGRLWAVREDRAGGKHAVTELMRRAGAVASFGETDGGEMLLLRYDGGRISRLVRKGE